MKSGICRRRLLRGIGGGSRRSKGIKVLMCAQRMWGWCHCYRQVSYRCRCRCHSCIRTTVCVFGNFHSKGIHLLKYVAIESLDFFFNTNEAPVSSPTTMSWHLLLTWCVLHPSNDGCANLSFLRTWLGRENKSLSSKFAPGRWWSGWIYILSESTRDC